MNRFIAVLVFASCDLPPGLVPETGCCSCWLKGWPLPPHPLYTFWEEATMNGDVKKYLIIIFQVQSPRVKMIQACGKKLTLMLFLSPSVELIDSYVIWVFSSCLCLITSANYWILLCVCDWKGQQIYGYWIPVSLWTEVGFIRF